MGDEEEARSPEHALRRKPRSFVPRSQPSPHRSRRRAREPHTERSTPFGRGETLVRSRTPRRTRPRKLDACVPSVRYGTLAGPRSRKPPRASQSEMSRPSVSACARLLRPWRTRRLERKPQADRYGHRPESGLNRPRWAAARDVSF
jgi:hypothetical protein